MLLKLATNPAVSQSYGTSLACVLKLFLDNDYYALLILSLAADCSFFDILLVQRMVLVDE